MRGTTPGGDVNRVKVGFFSLSGAGGSDEDAGDRAYLAWHQLDHMPEQYQLPGILHGQRWMSDDACHAARSAASGPFEDVHHARAVPDGRPGRTDARRLLRPREPPRAPRALPARPPPAIPGGAAAPGRPGGAARARLRRGRSVQAQPWRLPDRRAAGRWRPGRSLPALAATSTWPGWSPRRGSPGRGCSPPPPAIGGAGTPRVTIGSPSVYLDGDPGETATALGPLMEEAWRDAPVTPLLAAPFASLVPWVWPDGVYRSYD